VRSFGKKNIRLTFVKEQTVFSEFRIFQVLIFIDLFFYCSESE